MIVTSSLGVTLNLPLLGKLKSGEAVYDRPNTHLHDGVQAILPFVLSSLTSNRRQFFTATAHLNKIVGHTDCVKTDESDDVVWAQRVGRSGMTRFVKNRKPEPCSAVTVILKRDSRAPYYILITAFIGGAAEPEPWDPRATPKATVFWSSNALIWGTSEVVPGTETHISPW